MSKRQNHFGPRSHRKSNFYNGSHNNRNGSHRMSNSKNFPGGPNAEPPRGFGPPDQMGYDWDLAFDLSHMLEPPSLNSDVAFSPNSQDLFDYDDPFSGSQNSAQSSPGQEETDQSNKSKKQKTSNEESNEPDIAFPLKKKTPYLPIEIPFDPYMFPGVFPTNRKSLEFDETILAVCIIVCKH